MRSLGALLLLFASSAFAADPPETAPDAIAAAKKDLADIKALSTASPQSTVLPGLDIKTISPGPGAAPVEAPAPAATEDLSALDPSRKKEGTGNWLVDAMEKKPEGGAGPRAKNGGDTRTAPGLLQDGERTGSRGDDEEQADTRERAGSKEATGTAYNPLDAFMGAWISARDHDLLVPIAKGDGSSAGDLSKSSAANLPGVELGLQGTSSGVAFEPIDVPTWSEPKPEVNPYLAAMDLGTPPAPRIFASPEMPDFSTSALRTLPAASGADAASLDLSRTFVPDFAQPSDDDKYFKQMKKF